MTGPSFQKLSSQALAEKLFEFAPDGIVVADGDGRIIELNSQAERMFGYTRAEVLGLPVEALIPERFRAPHPAHRQNFGVRPSVRPMGMGLELHGRRKDGTEFPVDIMLSPLQVDGVPVSLAVVRDVTERERIEAALHRSEERFRLLVESVKDYAIFMLDSGGRVGILECRSGTSQRLPSGRDSRQTSRGFTREKISNAASPRVN